MLSVNNASAQEIKNYDTEWKKIDELIQKKNLPKSALAEVKKIYVLAKSENQEAQVIKALVYMTGLQEANREDNAIISIQELEKEIDVSKGSVAYILQSLLGGLYWQYLQNNRWQLYGRTNTVDFKKEDIATWTIEDLHKKISHLYLQSINNEALLKQTRLEPFDAIIIKGNSRPLRPTLYDLLANRALEYFSNDERDIKKPDYAFEINQPEVFADADKFIKTKFTIKDSLSLHQKALLIYQKLIAFHLNDANPDALIDVDINRIEFAYRNSVSPDKVALHKQALESIATKHGNNPAAARAWYLLAQCHNELANEYNPLKDTANRYERIRAKEILEKVVKSGAVKSEGWANSYNLLTQIIRPDISFEVEKVNVPGKPLRASMKYKNLTTINLRLIQVDSLTKALFDRRYENKFWDALMKIKPVKEWQQQLPETGDLQQHTVEIKVDALPVGEYYLFAYNFMPALTDKGGAKTRKAKTNEAASDNDDISKNSPLSADSFPVGAVSNFYVSNISYVQQSGQYFVLNRESGQPLAGAAVQVYTQQYDYQQSKNINTLYATYQTNKNGFFQIEKKKGGTRYDNSFKLDIKHGSDRLFMDESIYSYYPYSESDEKETTSKIFFFTDRSIYRPGQTVFFKGLVVAQRQVVSGYQTTLWLQDVNGQKVDSLKLTTNEFGSFSGKFTLPQNLLNGYFTVADKDMRNTVGFSVEEYKRPKFYVDFEKPKDSYKVGDEITVTGNAKAYAGNTVSGAKVAYRVIRQPRFLYSWWFKGWWPRQEPMEIAHGEVTTNEEGKFLIPFKALPDLKLDKKSDPVFDYQIYADVTDLNGETRSNTTSVSAGYKSLILKVQMDERLPVDSLKNISIRTENMSGEYQPATVTVSISKLNPETRLIRKRYWTQPDQFVLSKEEFVKLFPNDEYKDESDYRNWPEDNLVLRQTDSTKLSGQWAIDNKKLNAGFYKILIVTKDKEGNEVKDIRFIELFDTKNNRINKPDYLWTKGIDRPVEPGQKANIQIGSSAENIFVVSSIIKSKKSNNEEGQPMTPDFSFLHLGNEKKLIELDAKEEDRGGYAVNLFFVKNNRVYQFSDVVNIPWSNKDLNIEYTTYRDKTLPGSEERWKVKISGYKGDKVAAEMLAGMYDASLDQFLPHNWQIPGIWPVAYSGYQWNGNTNFKEYQSNKRYFNDEGWKSFDKSYDQLKNIDLNNVLFWFTPLEYSRDEVAGNASIRGGFDPAPIRGNKMMKVASTALAGDFNADADGLPDQFDRESVPSVAVNHKPDSNPSAPSAPVIRKNFNETAFFFPDLRTDKEGNIEFSFTMPEALTRWKLQTFAHTKDLAMGLSKKEVVTQKDLMVQPNAPRFLRQGDRMEFSAKIVNLSDKELTGQAELQLLDVTTNQPVDGWFQNVFPNQYFTVAAGGSQAVKFPIEVPYQFDKALTWRIVAKAGNFSDGEEMTLPVLTNKTLVTETLPLQLRGAGTKQYSFDKLLQSSGSESIQHQALTVEYTSNPAWYAVQALPYLMEYPYDCAEQTFNRYYANMLATKIVDAAPRIKQIFEKWKTADTAALLSNLQKNQELKSVLLEETPWVLQAKTEEQQKKNIALLFDLVRMGSELKANLQKLKEAQSSNGGFVWFKGGPDDRYITQYIATGIGHLKKLGAVMKDQEDDLNKILKSAIPYLDRKIKEDYDDLIKYKADLKKQNIGYTQVQYLYMRSFFADQNIPKASQTAYNYFQQQAKQYWMKNNNYMQGMIALALNRSGELQTAKAIVKSLKETAIIKDEMGMYWKESGFGRGWYWWQAPIETQALLIEVFCEISNDTKAIDDLKTWLLKNKQTTNWRTTKATADACYALLYQGTDWLSNEPVVTIQLGQTTISSSDNKTEAGTGYFKKSIESNSIKPEMGNVTVSISSPNGPALEGASWGSVYWQYFEDMDKITPASTPLQLSKKLFIEKNTDRGPVLSPVEEGATVKVGDKIKVRIELRVDRDMEYMHMKDMRAAALEPVNVLSGYKWQDGLGYYESTKDASTNFFISYLRKGTYVFEYPLFVTHAGDFSNGITTIQCMYAPEFSAHSEGVRLKVE